MFESTTTYSKKRQLLLVAAMIVAAVVLASVILRPRGDSPNPIGLNDRVEPPHRTPNGSSPLSALDLETPEKIAPEAEKRRPLGVDIVEAIIADQEIPLRQKAKSLFEEIDHLSGEAAIAACEHALLCLDGEAYEPAFEKLTAEGSGLEIQQTIMADLMGRDDFLRLPLLVRLASLPQHPFSEEARVELVAVLGNDYGSNWSGWADGVANHIELASVGAGIRDLQRPPAATLAE